MKSEPSTLHANQYTKYIKKHRVLLVLIIIFVFFAGMYGLGYRVGPGLTLNRVGTLTLTNLPKGTLVYADQVLTRTIQKDGNINLELVRGSHTIIVAAPDDYPWSSLVPMRSGVTTVVNPILVAMKPNATGLTGDERNAAFAAVASTTLPTIAHPLRLAGGCAAVYVDQNRVIAEATTTPGSSCTTPAFLCTANTCSKTIIFAPVLPLTTVLAFPSRQDALVVQLGHVLLAIALDPRNPQFFAPILTGVNPIAGALPDGTIVVRNNEVAYRLKL
jgi:hypothetical protein